MASLNKVQIIGNLGDHVELRKTQSSTEVVTMSVATTEYRNDKESGDKEAITTWHRIVVWGKTAVNCAKYLEKGSQVYVEGRLQTRQWEDKEGNKRYTTEIVAQNVLFLKNKSSEANKNVTKTPLNKIKKQQDTPFTPDDIDLPF